MKTISSLLLLFLLNLNLISSDKKSAHNFTVKNITGKSINLEKYKGKVLLFVNVASKCGYTKQYKGLTALQKEYKDKKFLVLGFPANNFGKQEPGTNKEIAQFCTNKFSVSFPMFSKIDVKGKNQVELFKFLTTEKNPDFSGDIKWNFEKILVGKDGKVKRRFRSKTTPESKEMKSAIDSELAK
ncbi:MAG: glutathione peroxidase [Planctomycetota bacterium]|nr:MAG: glutathione peroxidase [Planctomycetota bacterium]